MSRRRSMSSSDVTTLLELVVRREGEAGGGGGGIRKPLPALPVPSAASNRFFFERDNYAISCELQKEIKKNPLLITKCFDDILRYSREMIDDAYGNYLLSCIIEKCNSLQLFRLVSHLGHVLTDVSLGFQGSYCIQTMCTKARYDEKTLVLIWRYLKPVVNELCVNAYGNHCIQKLITSGKVFYFPDLIQIIIDNFKMICLNRYGTFIIQRCFDAVVKSHPVFRMEMVHKLNQDFLEISHNDVGNYSVQYMIKHMTFIDLDVLRSVIRGNIVELACSIRGSNVLEALVERIENRRLIQIIIDEMTERGNLYKIVTNHYGCFCLKKALKSLDVSYEGRQLSLCIIEMLPFLEEVERVRAIVDLIKSIWL